MSGSPRRTGETRNTQVINLLNTLGDRIVRSEKERFTVRAEMAETRELLSSLEDRAEQTERIFLTIQDKIAKQDSLETKILKRQDDLEKLQQENTERLARAEELALKIEEAIVLQNRLARRLERTAQDKVLILSKIERIEASVEQTREALSATALIRPSITLPQATNESRPLEDTPWWKKPLRTQAVAFASILIAGFLGGAAITQLITHWPQVQAVPAPSVQVASIPSRTEPLEETPDPLAELSMSADENNLAANNPDMMSDDDLSTAMDKNPDAVAAMLNKIEPFIGSESAEVAKATPKDEETGSENISPASLTPSDSAMPAAVPDTNPVLEKEESVGGVEEFIKSETDSTPIGERIQLDPDLLPVIRQIEMKALAGIPEAQHDLAAIYTAGHGGVKVDYTKASLWFREAAVNGIANARYNLGVLYHQGLGVEKDVNKAIKWYQAAAALGHPEAEYNLGIACIEGIGTQYDPRKAADYFEKAARGGVVEAAYNLGLIYENGLLGPSDTEEAVFWYKMASDYNPESRVAYDQLIKAMSLKPEDIDGIVKKFSAVYGLNSDGKVVPKTTEKKAEAQLSSDPVQQQTAFQEPVDLSAIPPLSKQDSQALVNSVSPDQALVSQIQEQLVRLGLYPGPADGFTGPQTEDAIRSYQSKNSMSITGHPSEELLVHMLASELNSIAGTLGDEASN